MANISNYSWSGKQVNKFIQDAINQMYANDTALNTLSSANILVGNGSNVSTAVAMSGEVTIDNTGATTISNSAVIGKVLTGYTAGSGSETVLATDSILQAIQKIDGNISAGYVQTVSSTDNAVVRFNSTAGQVQNSGVIIDNSNNLTGVNNVTIGGNLTVQGTTSYLETTNTRVKDKNIELNYVDGSSETDAQADGAGITIKGDTDKTLNWVNATDAFTSSEHIDVASGKNYYVNGTVLKEVTEELKNKTINASNNTISNISNDNISASAGIVYSKLSIADADLTIAKTNGLSSALSGKQDSDADLTAIAGLTPTNDDILQRKEGAWTNRTMAQLKTDLSLSNVNNTSDATKEVNFSKKRRISVSSNTSLTQAQVIGVGVEITSSTASLTHSLPAVVAANDGEEYLVENSADSTESFTLDSTDAYNIDGSATLVLTAGQFVKVRYIHSSTKFIAII